MRWKKNKITLLGISTILILLAPCSVFGLPSGKVGFGYKWMDLKTKVWIKDNIVTTHSEIIKSDYSRYNDLLVYWSVESPSTSEKDNSAYFLYNYSASGKKEKFFHWAYNYKTQKKQVVPKNVRWYFPDKNWLILEIPTFNENIVYLGKQGCFESTYYIFDLTTSQIKKCLGTENVWTQKYGFRPSFSHSGAFLYYINTTKHLIEKNLETMEEKEVMDLTEFIDKHQNNSIEIFASSPNRKYIPVLVAQNLYLINTETKKIKLIVGKLFGFLTGGTVGNVFWDSKSSYILFSTLNDLLPSFDSQASEIGCYSIEDERIEKIDTGSRYNSGFIYLWE